MQIADYRYKSKYRLNMSEHHMSSELQSVLQDIIRDIPNHNDTDRNVTRVINDRIGRIQDYQNELHADHDLSAAEKLEAFSVLEVAWDRIFQALSGHADNAGLKNLIAICVSNKAALHNEMMCILCCDIKAFDGAQNYLGCFEYCITKVAPHAIKACDALLLYKTISNGPAIDLDTIDRFFVNVDTVVQKISFLKGEILRSSETTPDQIFKFRESENAFLLDTTRIYERAVSESSTSEALLTDLKSKLPKHYITLMNNYIKMASVVDSTIGPALPIDAQTEKFEQKELYLSNAVTTLNSVVKLSLCFREFI